MQETILKLTVDAVDAIEKMDAFTQSASAAANAIERLESAFAALAGTLKTINGSPHGGITFQMVGQSAQAEVKPVDSFVLDITTICDSIRNGGDVAKTLEQAYGLMRLGR